MSVFDKTGCQFVYFDSLGPSQHFFSHVGTGLTGLNQYKAEDKVYGVLCSIPFNLIFNMTTFRKKMF